jgi:protein-S-isoprenylcysteine O-methyltransferase Ste14
MVVRFLAVVSGLVAILAPLIFVFHSSRRAKGRTIGSGAALRKWPAVAAMTIGFVALGVLAWRPLPITIPGGPEHILLALGGLLYFPAVGIYLWGLVTLGKEFGVSTSSGADIYADHHLIRSGPYQYVRHPMYLAVILAAVGALLIFRTWAMVIFLPMSLVVIRRANQEELLLEAEFAGEWQEYALEVPKWLPRWTKWE